MEERSAEEGSAEEGSAEEGSALREVSTLTAGALATVNHWEDHRLLVPILTLEVQDLHRTHGVQPVAAAVTYGLEIRLLCQDIGPGGAVAAAEADLHVVQVAAAFGDVPHLRVEFAVW